MRICAALRYNDKASLLDYLGGQNVKAFLEDPALDVWSHVLQSTGKVEFLNWLRSVVGLPKNILARCAEAGLSLIHI